MSYPNNSIEKIPLSSSRNSDIQTLGVTNQKRFVMIPLDIGNKDLAFPGELVTDRTNGMIYVVDDDGNLQSAYSSLEEIISSVVNESSFGLSFAYNHNRVVYRFFYENEAVRLDEFLKLPDSFKYYRIRDMDDAKYYVPELTEIGVVGASVYPFENNQFYFVEFFNSRKEMVSQIIFTARFAPSVVIDGDSGKIPSALVISTNKDFLYVTENVDSLIVRVYVTYEDGSMVDVTDKPGVVKEVNIDNTQVGFGTIRVTYYFDLDSGLYIESEKTISVIEDTYNQVIDMIVVPRKIIVINDGTRYIKLYIIAYYDNGDVRNVTDEVAISSNFNPTLFNTPQNITVKFNAGRFNTFEKDYLFTVKDDGSASDNVMYFDDNLIRIEPEYVYPVDAKYFRMRDVVDLDFFYTPEYCVVNYDHSYFDKSDMEDQLQTGKNVIVEFYDEDKKLLDSTVFVCRYQEII